MNRYNKVSLFFVITLLLSFILNSTSVVAHENKDTEKTSPMSLNKITLNIDDFKEHISIMDSRSVGSESSLYSTISATEVDALLSTSSLPVKEHPGAGATYILIDQFNGTSYYTDMLQEFASRLTVGLFGYKIKPVIGIFSQAFFDTFYNGPARKYYTSKHYYRKVGNTSYSKVVVETFSDSRRTKKINTVTRELKMP